MDSQGSTYTWGLFLVSFEQCWSSLRFRSPSRPQRRRASPGIRHHFSPKVQGSSLCLPLQTPTSSRDSGGRQCAAAGSAQPVPALWVPEGPLALIYKWWWYWLQRRSQEDCWDLRNRSPWSCYLSGDRLTVHALRGRSDWTILCTYTLQIWNVILIMIIIEISSNSYQLVFS